MTELRTVLGWIDGRLRLRWALLVPVMMAAAVIEAVGAMAVFGLLRLIVEPDRLRVTPILSDFWSSGPTEDPTATLGVLIAAVAAFYLVRAAILIWAEWLKEQTVARSAAQAAERLFARYLAADYLFHLRRRSASPIQEVSRSTWTAFQLIAGSVLNIFTELMTMVLLVSVLVLTAPGAALAIVAFVLAVVSVPIVVARGAWARAGEQLTALEEQQIHLLQQSLGALKEVKVAGREAFFESRLRATRRQLARVEIRRKTLTTALRLGVETALIVSLLVMVWLVVQRGTSGAGAASLLALFAYTGFRLVPSTNRLLLNASYYREGVAMVRNAIEDFRTLDHVPLRPHGSEPRVSFRDALVCEDLSFSYDSTGPAALSHVFLRLRPGESLGIVGATGSGKSTLVALLLGLLQPTSGRILIDGEPLAGRERAWQRLIGYVPQDPYLLDDTLRRNIALGVADGQIDEQRVARAVVLAQLQDVVNQLPERLDTPVAEHGARLSGGQRQRLAIARALYAEPEVLIFDEATAALDPQTERELTSAIASLHGSRTMIVIAHRLSTVEGCDRLIFLQNGRVAATGSYGDLLGNAAFRAMAAQ